MQRTLLVLLLTTQLLFGALVDWGFAGLGMGGSFGLTAGSWPSDSDRPESYPSAGYNRHGDVLREEDANGNVVVYTYDIMSRLATKTVTRGTGIGGTTEETWNWDRLSRPVLAENDEVKLTFYYDSLGNLLEEKVFINDVLHSTLENHFDGRGNRIGTIRPSERILVNDFDGLGRLKEILSGTATIASYEYAGHRVLERHNGNGTKARFTYDEAPEGVLSRLADVHHFRVGDDHTLARHGFDYDASGNKTSVTDHALGLSRAYKFDSINRLVESGLSRTSPAEELLRQDYGFDAVGNRDALTYMTAGGFFSGGSGVSPVLGGVTSGGGVAQADNLTMESTIARADNFVSQAGSTTLIGGILSAPTFLNAVQQAFASLGIAGVYTAPNLNQYTATPNDARTYDVNGNTKTITTGGVTRTFVYDYRNRITEYKEGETTLVAYKYDPLGRRVARTAGGSTTVYTYDGWRLIEERADGYLVAEYLNGGMYIDEVVMIDRPEDEAELWLHQDDMFNVVACSDEAGDLQESVVYGDYGQIMLLDAAGDIKPLATSMNTRWFQGRDYDPITRMYHFRAREMDPWAGRFLQRDPMGIWFDGLHMGNGYAFGAGNPLVFVDPYGMESIYLRADFYTTFGREYIRSSGQIAVTGAAGAASLALDYGSPGSAGGIINQAAPSLSPLLRQYAANGTLNTQIREAATTESEAIWGQYIANTSLLTSEMMVPIPLFEGAVWLKNLARGAKGAGALDDVGRAALQSIDDGGKAAEIVPTSCQTSVGNLTAPISELRAAGLKDAHHVVQDAAVRELAGYSSQMAPGVQLAGPSTAVGSPHYIATQVQRQAGGGTLGAEMRIGYKALRLAGYSEPQARQIIAETGAYFRSIGATPSTPTRIPGNRP